MLKCGVAGLGRGRKFIDAFSATDGCKVVAAFDPNPEAAGGISGMAVHTDLEAFLDEDLDIAAIISPGPVHAEQSLAALERGMHVLVEKPVATTLDDANRILEASSRSGQRTTVDFMLRFNPIVETLHAWCRSGCFGRLGNNTFFSCLLNKFSMSKYFVEFVAISFYKLPIRQSRINNRNSCFIIFRF